MKKVIISGAAGFIGNAVARRLIEQGVRVVAVVKPGVRNSEEAFRLENMDALVVECDLKDIGKLPLLIGDRGYDAFYQFAWDGVDKEAFLSYEKQVANINWTLKSIEAAALLKCNKYIGAGSITQLELLSHKGRLFTADRHKYYRVAQLASETMGRACAAEKGIEFIWPVIINVYGEGETAPRLINSMIENLLDGKYQSFSSGEQIYDFLHIEDAAKAFCLIGEKGKAESEYIIGSGRARPLKEYLRIVRDITAPEMELGLGDIEFTGLEMTKDMFDISSLVEDTGFAPEIEFEAGITRTLEWVKKGRNNVKLKEN